MPPFRHRMPVRFADVDHAGIVYYPVFFHYFHVAFEELFIARMGAHSYVELLDRDRIGFPAVSSSCDFKAPLRFGDTVEIELAVERLGEKSITFHYRVWKAAEGDRAAETLAAAFNPGGRYHPDWAPGKVNLINAWLDSLRS